MVTAVLPTVLIIVSQKMERELVCGCFDVMMTMEIRGFHDGKRYKSQCKSKGEEKLTKMLDPFGYIRAITKGAKGRRSK